MWSPYGIDNDDRVARWSDTARRELSKLVVDIADPEETARIALPEIDIGGVFLP